MYKRVWPIPPSLPKNRMGQHRQPRQYQPTHLTLHPPSLHLFLLRNPSATVELETIVKDATQVTPLVRDKDKDETQVKTETSTRKISDWKRRAIEDDIEWG